MSGRHEWPNRDSIQELGGINLFSIVLNNPLNKFDVFGHEEGKSGVGDTIKDTIKEKGPEVCKKICEDHANEPIGKRGALPGSGAAGGAGAIGGAVVEAGTGVLQAGPGIGAIAYIKKMCKDCNDCVSGQGKYEDCPAANCDTPCKICNDAKNRMSGPINRL